MINVVISIVSLIYLGIMAISYFSKARVASEENKIYSKLVLAAIFELIIDIGGYYCIKNFSVLHPINVFISKTYLISYSIWALLFTDYFLLVSYNIEDSNYNLKVKRVKRITVFVSLVSIIMLYILPLNINVDGNAAYSFGYGVYYLIGLAIICFGLMFYSIIVKGSNIRKKQYLPLPIFLLFGFICVSVQIINPEITLLTFLNSTLTSLMFFTIENPDAKLVEYEKTEKERAEAASLAKSEFLSSMSHELRTPLNAIVGLSEDIDSYKDKVPSEVREDTKDIINASNTLLEIIGSILDISKIESGKLDIVEGNYDPREEFESVAKINRTKFSEKKLEFNVKIADNLPEVLYGDRLRIKQILNNFLSNAYKYTDGGHVDYIVNWLDASGSLQIIVSDTGRGVKPEDIDKLFAKYDRLGVEKSSNVQGTGLGLAITKTLIDLMGGTVKVDSEYLVGTTFTVTLPQKLGDKEELERIKKENEKVVEKLDYTGKRILVVDDNMLNIKVLKKAIKEFNFIIDECYNGKEAIEKIEMNNNYDIVLLDILMPIMRGDEAINYIRNMPNFHAPVVALTADAMTGAKEKYQAMGFDDYLAKPFTRDAIAKKLSSILGNGKEEKPKKEKSNLENTATINVKEVNVTVNNYNNEGK